MASEVEICNLALIHIGTARISSFDDRSEPARVCKLLYALARDDLLRGHSWGFTKRYEALAELSTVTTYRYDYAYTYPADCLLARGIYRAVPTADPIPFQIVSKAEGNGKEIWTNEVDAVLEYTKRITDTNVFDIQFTIALGHYLATLLAPTLVKDVKLRAGLIQDHLRAAAEAILSDLHEGFNNDTPASNDFFNQARE